MTDQRSGGSLDSSTYPSFRVATLNLLHPAPEYPEGEAFERLCEGAEHLRDVDVVLLQEVEKLEDGRLSSAHLADLLGMKVAAESPVAPNKHGNTIYCSILTSLPVLWSAAVSTPGGAVYPVTVLLAPSGRPIMFFSVHLSWGSDKEGQRLAQVLEIEKQAETLSEAWSRNGSERPVVVIGGDFNASPASETVRVAMGLQSVNGSSFKWTEAMEAVGEENWIGPVWSQEPSKNMLAARTARGVGIDRPELLRNRRIDFIFTRGWAFGRPGCPVRGETRGHVPILSDLPASDHNIVVVDLLDPEK